MMLLESREGTSGSQCVEVHVIKDYLVKCLVK